MEDERKVRGSKGGKARKRAPAGTLCSRLASEPSWSSHQSAATQRPETPDCPPAWALPVCHERKSSVGLLSGRAHGRAPGHT